MTKRAFLNRNLNLHGYFQFSFNFTRFLLFLGRIRVILNKYQNLHKYMYQRLLNIPENSRQSYFIFGPRGTGKSSWLKSKFDEHVYIDLLDADNFIKLQGDPKALSHYIPANYQGWIIIDEVQKIPELLDEIHRLIENDKHRFILTGSSARKLKQKGVNLLAGRAIRLEMHPLTAVELGDDFDIQKSLQVGHLPSCYTYENANDYLSTYVQMYLQEEVLQEGLTRNLSSFTRFLANASFSQGSMINQSEIARETAVKLHVVNEYFSILEDLLIAQTMPVFTKRAKRRMVAHPKFYYFDTGVFRFLRPQGLLDSPSEIGGICLESLFYQEIKAINSYFKLGYDCYFWRTSHGTEVDFILYGQSGFHAFEIKHDQNFSNKDLSGLRSFKKDYPQATCYFLSMSENEGTQDDINIMNIAKALKNLPGLLSAM